MEILKDSIYDHPKYYDLVFGADCAAELRLIEACNARFLDGRGQRMFEPACGTGRLLYRLARKGYHVGGIDLNPQAVAFCNERLRRHGLPESAWVADMADFRLDRPYDLALNTINSFRHLGSQRAAENHLRCVAEAIRPGGLYLLGIHLTPTAAAPMEGESWSARRGHLAVNTRMWTIERSPRKRVERFGIQFEIHTPRGRMRIDDVLVLRSYTAQQFNRLLRSVGWWEIVATTDFAYELDHPVEVDAATEDVVYILRRRTKPP